MEIKKCQRCKLPSEKLRRNLCLKCYRIVTGFSGGDSSIFQIEKEIPKLKQRIKIIEEKLTSLRSIQSKS